MTFSRLSAEDVEALTVATAPKSRLSAEDVEALTVASAPKSRLSAEYVEVLVSLAPVFIGWGVHA